MTILRCKDVVKTFNKRSAKLKADAIKNGMKILKEWQVEQLNCFHAEASQEKLKLALSVYSECGACVNVNPTIWESFAGSGKIGVTTLLELKAVAA